MNISLTTPGLLRSLKKLLQRFHFLLFILVIAGGLALAIFTLNTLITRSQQQGEPVSNPTFDTKTIDRINQLRTRDDTNENITLPEGRINPFVE